MQAKRINELPVGCMFCVMDILSKATEIHNYYILKSVNGIVAVVDRVFSIKLLDSKPHELYNPPERGIELKSDMFVNPIKQRKVQGTVG